MLSKVITRAGQTDTQTDATQRITNRIPGSNKQQVSRPRNDDLDEV